MMDWIGTAFLLYGLYLIGKKDRLGFAASAVGCACWLVYGIVNHIHSLAFVNIIFTTMNTWNWYKWRQKPKAKRRKS